MAAVTTHNDHLIHLEPKWHPYFDRQDSNLESYQLLWLDIKLSDLEDEDNILDTLVKFRQLVNYTKAFDYWKYCLRYIEKCHDTYTFLVCSSRYAEDMIFNLQPFTKTNVWKVYIYGENEVFHSKTLKIVDENKKTCSVHSKLDNLLENIKKDLSEYFKHEKAGIFSDQNPTLEVSVDDNFELWWHNISKVLISLSYPDNYHHRLVTALKEHGFADPIIDEFQRDFPSKRRAIWWYTRSSIFYDILNRAFRKRNIKVLLLFGSFVQDLYLELKTEQYKHQQSHSANPIIKVYRGQVLSEKDLAKFATGFSIQNMALLSASTHRVTAKQFLFASSDLQDVSRILFEIEIDYRHTTAVFSDITQLSSLPDERETLFMVNTRFLFQSQHECNDLPGLQSYWLVKLKLQSFYDILRDRQLKVKSERKTLKNCLNALSDMSELISTVDDTIVFDILMNIYPDEEKWIRAIQLCCLAEFEAQRCDDPRENKHGYSSALPYYGQAVAIWKTYLRNDELNCSFDIAGIYLAMAQLYECGPPRSNHLYVPYLKKAVQSYELALQKCSATDYEEMEIVYKLDDACRNLAKTDGEAYGAKAVSYKERWIELIMREAIPPKPKSIAVQYEDLADRYVMVNRYEDALSYYKKALELYLSNNVEEASLSSVMDLYRRIVTVYTKHTHDFDLALHYELLRHEYRLKELAGRQTALPERHLNSLAESYFSVADCYINTRQFILAHKHWVEGLACMRQRRDLILKEGHLVIREGRLIYASDGQPLQEPWSPDDNYLRECDEEIKKKEEKLRYLQTLLES